MDDRPNIYRKKSSKVDTHPQDKIRFSDKVRFLSARSSYPDRPKMVEVGKTSMSWIFLAVVPKSEEEIRFQTSADHTEADIDEV